MSLVHETNISIKNLGSFFVCFPCFRKFTYVVDDEEGKASVPNKMNLKENKGNKYLENILTILLPTRSWRKWWGGINLNGCSWNIEYSWRAPKYMFLIMSIWSLRGFGVLDLSKQNNDWNGWVMKQIYQQSIICVVFLISWPFYTQILLYNVNNHYLIPCFCCIIPYV